MPTADAETPQVHPSSTPADDVRSVLQAHERLATAFGRQRGESLDDAARRLLSGLGVTQSPGAALNIIKAARQLLDELVPPIVRVLMSSKLLDEPDAPVDNSHDAMERRGELHAMLSDCIDLAHGVGDSKRIIAAAARAVELCASHGVDDVAAMLAVIAEERS